jgi:hypothetical protein
VINETSPVSTPPLAGTPIQSAIVMVIGAYAAAFNRLTAAERDVLRDVIAARLARDYLAERGELDTWETAA